MNRLKRYNDFLDKNPPISDKKEPYISGIEDVGKWFTYGKYRKGTYVVYEEQVKKHFGYLGEGDMEVEVESIHSSQEGGYYSNTAYIRWSEMTWGGYELNDLKKADELLKQMEGKNGIQHYIIEEGYIRISFKDELGLELY